MRTINSKRVSVNAKKDFLVKMERECSICVDQVKEGAWLEKVDRVTGWTGTTTGRV
jgi:hypothetical protein